MAEDAADSAARGHDAFVTRVARAARVYNLSTGEVALAAEIADLEPDLVETERRALFLLAVAILVFERQGSTRVPVGRAACDPDMAGGQTAAADPTPALIVVVSQLLAETASQSESESAAVGSPRDATPPSAAPEEVLLAMDRLLADERAPTVIGGPETYRPLIHVPPYLWAQRLFALEARLGKQLAERIARPSASPSPIALEQALQAARQVSPHPLTREQARAVSLALGQSLTLVTGGPGTGKTTIVAAVATGLINLGTHSIALAAPTGKAAWRLKEAVAESLEAAGAPEDHALGSVESRTLHRLLGYQPSIDRFLHHRQNPLPYEAVIVDEASMIDLALMERLVSALAEDARLVLLGDADQLPSVDAGAVFRDLVAAGEDRKDQGTRENPGKRSPLAGHVIRLQENFRARAADPAGRALLDAAREINLGRSPAEHVTQRNTAGAIAFHGVEGFGAGAGAPGREAFLTHWYDHRLAGDRATDTAPPDPGRVVRVRQGRITDEADRASVDALLRDGERSRILCLTHHERAGTEAMNTALHRRHAIHTRGDAAAGALPGEPVMVLANDYERGLFNGDAGVVVWARDEHDRIRLHAVFRRGHELAAWPWEVLRGRLARAWAITVHKSQGSEYDAVALMLPDENLPLLTRELLYTAITRARTSVVFVGHPDRLAQGAARRIQRFSGVGERLVGGGGDA